MNILHKIEEIRRQPEHIRLRWVWGLTAGFMTAIIFMWIILLKGQSVNMPENILPEDSNLSSQFNQEKKSIKDAVGQLKGATNAASMPSSSIEDGSNK